MIKNLWFITDYNYEYFLFAYVISYLIEVISFFPPENTRSESFTKEYEAVWI